MHAPDVHSLFHGSRLKSIVDGLYHISIGRIRLQRGTFGRIDCQLCCLSVALMLKDNEAQFVLCWRWELLLDEENNRHSGKGSLGSDALLLKMIKMLFCDESDDFLVEFSFLYDYIYKF